MTHSSKHFSTYSPCPIHKKIATADKSLASVAGIGDVPINPSITLKIVIHDPKLPINLVYVQDSHKTYFVMWFFIIIIVYFRTKIQVGRLDMLENGMVFTILRNQTSQICLRVDPLTHLCQSLLSNKAKVLLYHYQLGHPSFRVIKVLFPSLFSKLNVENLHCQVCEIAKHKRIPFPVSNKRNVFPLYLVHTDVWCPTEPYYS